MANQAGRVNNALSPERASQTLVAETRTFGNSQAKLALQRATAAYVKAKQQSLQRTSASETHPKSDASE